jgi:hypothetical protein
MVCNFELIVFSGARHKALVNKNLQSLSKNTQTILGSSQDEVVDLAKKSKVFLLSLVD